MGCMWQFNKESTPTKKNNNNNNKKERKKAC